jgi:hypothetical protein
VYIRGDTAGGAVKGVGPPVGGWWAGSVGWMAPGVDCLLVLLRGARPDGGSDLSLAHRGPCGRETVRGPRAVAYLTDMVHGCYLRCCGS